MRWIAVLALVAACGGGTPSTPDAATPDATALDAPHPLACPPCAFGFLCVQKFDGVCNSFPTECVQTDLTCPPNTCSPECEAALCPSPFQCQDSTGCGTEAPGAFTCYGP